MDKRPVDSIATRRDWLQSGLAIASLLALGPAAAAESKSAASPQLVPVALGDHINRAFVLPLLDLIADGAGIQWQIEWMPFARTLLQAERGQSLGFGMARTPARERVYAFSEVLFFNHAWPVVRRERRLNIQQLSDLDGLSVCLGRGVSLNAAFEEARGKRFQVETASGDLASRVRMLMAGRCDVVLASHRSPDPWLIEQRLRKDVGLGTAIEVLPKPLMAEPVHFAVGLDTPLAALLPRVNKGMAARRQAIRALIDSER
jgi:polar amino acid transport system substrate-binding protein